MSVMAERGILTTTWRWDCVRLNGRAGGSAFRVETARKESRKGLRKRQRGTEATCSGIVLGFAVRD